MSKKKRGVVIIMRENAAQRLLLFRSKVEAENSDYKTKTILTKLQRFLSVRKSELSILAPDQENADQATIILMLKALAHYIISSREHRL